MAENLLKPTPQAAPERSVELRKRSEERTDDPFDLPPKDFAELVNDGSAVKVSSTPIENSMVYVGMNTTKPPFDNPKIRRAVNLALDRNGFVTAQHGAARHGGVMMTPPYGT